jgi:hypothetical protein
MGSVSLRTPSVTSTQKRGLSKRAFHQLRSVAPSLHGGSLREPASLTGPVLQAKVVQFGISAMLIEAGYDIAFDCPAQTPMLLQLSIHPSRDADLLAPDKINCDPNLTMRSYIDHFGNRVTRVEVPAGFVTFSNRFVIHDSGQPEETPPDTEMTPITDLPDDVLLFLLQSRYCDSDQLADFAWSNFGMMSGGR